MAELSCGTACFILRDDGFDRQFLLIQRPSGGAGALRWSVPGGKMERGESWRATMDREIEEETGLVTRQPRLIAVTTAISDTWVTIWGRTWWRGGEAQITDEAADFAWVTVTEALAYPLWDQHWKPLLAELGAEGLSLALEE